MDLARLVEWGDLVPHVRFHERRQEDYWYIGDQKLYGVGAFAQARWPEYPPSHPRAWPTRSRPPSTPRHASTTWTRSASTTRCCTRTSSGSTATCSSTSMPPELATECVRAYNDWLVRVVLGRRRRLIPDDDVAVLGPRGVGARWSRLRPGAQGRPVPARYDKVGLPRLVDDHWEPLLGQAQEMGLSMNFHVGFLSSPDDLKGADQSKKLDFTRESSLVLLGTRRTSPRWC